MISTSLIYFAFLISSVVLYYAIPARIRNYFLVAISLFFYAYVKVSYLLIVGSIITVNYFVGIAISKAIDKKLKTRYLYFSMFINIGILVYFKYWNFIIDNISVLGGGEFLKNNFIISEILLPLGLSYYIFQNIGYVLDIYRGAFKPEKDFIRFSLFTLFFPKLLVGPIERARNFLPQLAKEISFDPDNIIEGSKRIAWGLFKKLVVADRISLYVDAVYSNLPHHNTSTFLFATFLYPIQVYADFSGYTDIALGTARLFGFNLIDNFKRPLFARNISDFWRRWHISLSSWVNDYIYNPIVFKRRDWGNWSIFYALLISFVIIGVWHGASWNFVLFGTLQALVLTYEALSKNWRKKISKKLPLWLYNNVSHLLTFLFFTFSLIIFRTVSGEAALNIINVAQSGFGRLFIDKPSTMLFIFIGIVILLSSEIITEYKLFENKFGFRNNWLYQQIAFALLLIYIIAAGVFDGGQFIYFAF